MTAKCPWYHLYHLDPGRASGKQRVPVGNYCVRERHADVSRPFYSDKEMAELKSQESVELGQVVDDFIDEFNSDEMNELYKLTEDVSEDSTHHKFVKKISTMILDLWKKELKLLAGLRCYRQAARCQQQMTFDPLMHPPQGWKVHPVMGLRWYCQAARY